MAIPADLSKLIAQERPRFAVYATARGAVGRCYEASSLFAEIAQKAGLNAEPWPAWADDLGMAERVDTPWLQDDSHCATVIRHPDGLFTVDWTAAQYGRTEFPLVRKVSVLPRRDPWLLSAAEAADVMAQLKQAAERGELLF